LESLNLLYSIPHLQSFALELKGSGLYATMSKEPLDQAQVASEERPESLTDTGKNKWERLWPVIACGAGLFSDGYLNNVSEYCARSFWHGRLV
jgi:hypothetical protein